jgi:multiple sugar transport system substrate-binding protein
MNIRKYLCASILGTALAGLGCHGRFEDPHTLRFRYWGDLEEIALIEGLVKQFEAAHPGVTIKPERKPADRSYADLLLTEFASSAAPDVIFISTNDFAQFVGPGKFLALDPFLAREKVLKKSDFYHSMTETFSRSGTLYALPRDVAPVACVFYNKKLFDQARLPYPRDDWSWEDLRKMAIRLTKRDGDGEASQFGFADDWNLSEAWMLSAGGGMVDDYMHPTRLTANSRESLVGLKFRQRLALQDRVMPLASENQSLNTGPTGSFINGTLAMLHSGIWKTPAFRKIVNFDWDIAYFPKGPKGRRAFPAGGSGYAISSDTKKASLAWEFVKFMGGPEGQRVLASSGLIQPALRKLAESPAFLDGKKPKNKRFLLQAAELGVPQPQMGRWQEYVTSIWNPVTDPMWMSGATPADVDRLVNQAVDEGEKGNYF